MATLGFHQSTRFPPDAVVVHPSGVVGRPIGIGLTLTQHDFTGELMLFRGHQMPYLISILFSLFRVDLRVNILNEPKIRPHLLVSLERFRRLT